MSSGQIKATLSRKRYTCADYRREMVLLGLKRRLHMHNLSKTQRRSLLAEIRELESELQMD